MNEKGENEKTMKCCMEPEPMMIINEISKIFRDEMRHESEKAGVSGGYRQILRYLSFRNGCTQLELSKAARLKPPTVSITVRKMEADGFVRREIDPKDLRIIRVYLTDKGMEIEEKNREKIRTIDALVHDGLTEQEREQLLKLLLSMRSNLCRGLGIEEPVFSPPAPPQICEDAAKAAATPSKSGKENG